MAHLLGGPLGRAAWTIYTAVYDVMWNNHLTAFLCDEVRRSIPLGSDIIEVGAGTGLFSYSYLDQCASAEVSEPLPLMRRRFSRRHGFEPGEAGLEDIEPGGGHRVVVACNVLHLVPDAQRAIEHLQLLAGVAGRVLVLTPTRPAEIREIVSLLRAHGGNLKEVMKFMGSAVLAGPLIAALLWREKPDYEQVSTLVGRRLAGPWVLAEWDCGEATRQHANTQYNVTSPNSVTSPNGGLS